MSLLSFLIWSIEVCPLGLYLNLICAAVFLFLRSYHLYLRQACFNLLFARVLEKVAGSQPQSYLELNNLYEPLQSGVRPLHCTETGLLRVVADLLLSADSGFLTFLLLLDLSSAFDTITKLSLSVFLPLASKVLYFPASPWTFQINNTSSLFKDTNSPYSHYLWCSSRICSRPSALYSL